MTTFVPDAGRLLQAAVDHLESDLMPALEGYHRFQLRVCINSLRIVGRELAGARALEQAEHARLQAVLGCDGSLETLNAQLTDRIASGELALDSPALVAHLQATLRDALSINNPSWIDGPPAGT